jgi:hypothetical protein
VLLLEGGTLKKARIFSQESIMKIEVLEREEGAQALNLKEYSHFSEWPMTQRGRWGLLPQKESLGGFPPDKSGEPLWSPTKSLWKPATNWTSPVTPPDKSSEGLWNPVERFWNSVSNRTSLTNRTNPVPPPDKSSGALWSLV